VTYATENSRRVALCLRWKVREGGCRDCPRRRGRGVRCRGCAAVHSRKQNERNKARRIAGRAA